jgi:hypothetical protein
MPSASLGRRQHSEKFVIGAETAAEAGCLHWQRMRVSEHR